MWVSLKKFTGTKDGKRHLYWSSDGISDADAKAMALAEKPDLAARKKADKAAKKGDTDEAENS